ncbi:MAG TPA: hypothetical protein VFY84_06450 [Jiangellales bacterium]|nr:hypothetical protein [Jiangellales bacterium]
MTAPRAMTLAALFVTGSIAGAAAVTLASNASDAPPTLIAGPVSYVDYEQSADGLVSLTVEMFNASERAVPVAVTSIAGWLVSISDANTPVVPPGTWTQLEITAAANCDVERTNAIAVDAGAHKLAVELDQSLDHILHSVHDELCGSTPYVFATTEVESATADDQGLRIDLRLLGHGHRPAGDLHIIDAHSRLTGTTFHVANLPRELPVDGSTAVDAYWIVDDCPMALDAMVHPAVTFLTMEGVLVEAPLDDRGVAVLARYIAQRCTPG